MRSTVAFVTFLVGAFLVAGAHPTPAQGTESDSCKPAKCDYESQFRCREPRPECGQGAVPTVGRDGCWESCVSTWECSDHERFNCNAAAATCAEPMPGCVLGKMPTVTMDGCWGPCVEATSCVAFTSCDSDEECPYNNQCNPAQDICLPAIRCNPSPFPPPFCFPEPRCGPGLVNSIVAGCPGPCVEIFLCSDLPDHWGQVSLACAPPTVF